MVLFVYRLFYPKTRTISYSDTSTLLSCSLFTLIINGGLLNWYIKKILINGGLEFFPRSFHAILKALFDLKNIGDPFRVLNLTGTNGLADLNFFALLIELHLRTLLFSLAILLFLKFLGWLEETLQSIHHLPLPKIRWWHMCFCRLLGHPLNLAGTKKFDQEKVVLTLFGYKPIKFFREAFFHPWALLTLNNRKKELLMVDVLTEEGSFYSGTMSTWVPDGDSYSEISMTNCLRFLPLSNNDQNSSDTKTNEKPYRSMRFFKNNGELILSKNRIETIHFWKIVFDSKFAVPVKNENDLERVKWYLVLAYLNPGFIKTLDILIEVDNSTWGELKEKLLDWMFDNGIKFSKKGMRIKTIRKKD